jgi:hypothetical protein
LRQSTYSDYQIGPFENLHQLLENEPLVVLGARLKIFFQYSLRFADRLKRQPLISHLLLPHQKWLRREADREIKSALRLPHQFLFRYWDLYFVMAFLFRPKMWGRLAKGSEAKEAPPLFVIGPEGDGQLVNYRVRQNYYIVDRLFAAAELRMGGEHQQWVRISRTDGRAR